MKGLIENLLDRLIDLTGARRALVVMYLQESSEAEIICARHFESRNLSLEEHALSRTVLRKVLATGQSFHFQDLLSDPAFGSQASVRELGLRSVVAVPLKTSHRILGALYLDNNTLAGAFLSDHLELVETAAALATFYLNHSGLVQRFSKGESRIFLEVDRVAQEIVGLSAPIQELRAKIHQLANSPATVLVEGETGTGKELVARALHSISRRADHPFVPINCAAIPKDLLESELFGHERGAFTGASERFIGRAQQAHRGTLFLDEISELDYALQAKLLRFLESRESQRLGSAETQKVDVRVIAATSRDLKKMVESNAFQPALFYRLFVVPIAVPALRNRMEDIPMLAEHFLKRFASAYEKTLKLGASVVAVLQEYSFPGNVRELENLVHRLVALSTGVEISLSDLPADVLLGSSHRLSLAEDPLYKILHTPPASLEEFRQREDAIRHILAEQRRQLIEQAVKTAGGNVTAAANQLGLHRVTVHKALSDTPVESPGVKSNSNSRG